MITDIFRLDDNVPRIYVNESRDFQMLCRLFTYGINPSKYEVETLHYLNSGMLTNDRLLGNLCEKPGFMDGEEAKGDKLRYITENFAGLVRDKGAEIGILDSIYLYLIMYNLTTAVYLQLDKDNFIIRIGIKSTVRDIDILYTILKYIVPIGWIIEIFFYAELKVVQGYYYKDTLVNMIKRASARNALYIINTTTRSDGLNPNIIGLADSITYDKFGTPDGSKMKQLNYEQPFGTTHITKFTNGLALASLSTDAIVSLLEDSNRLKEYGAELWDAKPPVREGRDE